MNILKNWNINVEIHIVKIKDIKLHINRHIVSAFEQNYTDLFIILFLFW